MPRKANEDKSVRFNLVVPAADIQVCEWLNFQRNMSFSVRIAIKKIMELYGMTDITCLPTDEMPSISTDSQETNESDFVAVSQPQEATVTETVKTEEPAVVQPVVSPQPSPQPAAPVATSSAPASIPASAPAETPKAAATPDDNRINEMYDSLLDLS